MNTLGRHLDIFGPGWKGDPMVYIAEFFSDLMQEVEDIFDTGSYSWEGAGRFYLMNLCQVEAANAVTRSENLLGDAQSRDDELIKGSCDFEELFHVGVSWCLSLYDMEDSPRANEISDRLLWKFINDISLTGADEESRIVEFFADLNKFIHTSVCGRWGDLIEAGQTYFHELCKEEIVKTPHASDDLIEGEDFNAGDRGFELSWECYSIMRLEFETHSKLDLGGCSQDISDVFETGVLVLLGRFGLDDISNFDEVMLRLWSRFVSVKPSLTAGNYESQVI